MVPGSVHLSPTYPSAQLHVSLAMQAPCTQGGSQITIIQTNQIIYDHIHSLILSI